MWESRVLRRAFERLELHEGKLSRAVLRGGGGGDVTSLPDAGVGNHPGLPGPAPHDQGKLWVFSLGRGKGVGKPVLMCPFAITRIGVMTNGVQSRKLDSRL